MVGRAVSEIARGVSKGLSVLEYRSTLPSLLSFDTLSPLGSNC
jgi:hypothetical protein